MEYIERESYLHKYAKNLLADWLKEAQAENDYCQFCDFVWRSNYGVFTELKFHETDDPYYFENSKAIKFPGSNFDNPLGMIDPTVDRGKILFVPDIVVFHKGTPKYIIEVVHTNPVSEKKKSVIADFFKNHHIELFEVFASDILQNTCVPTSILSRKIAL